MSVNVLMELPLPGIPAGRDLEPLNRHSEFTQMAISPDTLPKDFQQGGIEGGSVGVNFGGGRGSPHPFTPDDSCGDDIFEGAMEDMRSPQLPYLTQDQWTCARKAENVTVWTMQDGDLK
ncbi:hypothetical protein B484DRAFT_395195, partial [Ochromonadaceae sp. CCMP2298]